MIEIKTKTYTSLIDIKESSSVIATDNTQSAEDDVKPMDNETVQKVKKQMEKMKMNRDLEHIQVISESIFLAYKNKGFYVHMVRSV